MNNPLISVVIPTYNHAHFIKNAIDSVIKQTYNNWELIVVDNHSTDNTDEILSAYCDKKEYNLRVVKVHNDGIIALSRNAGVKVANGEWIAFLDSDDGWTDDKLQKCVAEMDDTVILLFHDLVIQTITAKRRKKKLKGRRLSKPVLVDLLCNGNAISNSTVVVRKQSLEQVGFISTQKEMVAAEDFNTWLKLASVSNEFKYIPLCLGYYTIHGAGMSRKDMSVSMYYATAEFCHILTPLQQKKSQSRIKYTHSRFLYNNEVSHSGLNDLTFCLLYGGVEIKVKSIYLILMMVFRNCFKLLKAK